VHIPDGFISGATSAGAAVAAVGGVAVALRRSGKELERRRVPMAGLVAAFIFALQMLNFPVAAGTSGHLLGGALAAVLLGPWMGLLAVTVVVVLQSLIFADGGVSALGLNVLNMAIVTSLVGWVVFVGSMVILRKRTSSVVVSSFVAGAISVIASSMAFAIEYAFGGQGGAPIGTVFTAMVGVHSLIGLGEGLITAATVAAVLAVRPDLVTGARRHRLEASIEVSRRGAFAGFVAAGLTAAVLLVVFVAPFASPDPDGLESVAEQGGFIDTADDHPIGGPLADYGVTGIESVTVGTAIAGVIGVLLTFLVGLLVFRLFSGGDRSRLGQRAGPS
jgi:cobalt/nickel transport system permease protein